MRRIATTLLALAISLAATVPAAAEEAPRIKEIDFEDDHIQGELLSADQLRIVELEKPQRASLVRARADFVGRLLVAVEDLGQ